MNRITTSSRSENIRFLKTATVIILAMMIIGYATWRSLDYFRGPQVTIFEPPHGASFSSQTVIIRGQAERVNKLLLNGYPISMDERGAWQEIIVLFPGLNKITIAAYDQFGRSSRYGLDIVGETN